ncbi:MAG: hypothetical protein H6Q42_2309, partial [Deltaproteobacteria bacterium]|nr:hypothetical protein [Deltaproteobacteria bacterium]
LPAGKSDGIIKRSRHGGIPLGAGLRGNFREDAEGRRKKEESLSGDFLHIYMTQGNPRTMKISLPKRVYVHFFDRLLTLKLTL